MSLHTSLPYSIIPNSPKNKLEFGFRFVMLCVVWGGGLLLFNISHNTKNQHQTLVYIVLLILMFLLSFYLLTGKITKALTVNYNSSCFEINYFTLFSKNKKILIPFNKLKYSYKWQPSKYPPKKYRLKIYNLDRLVFSIDSSDGGFEENQFIGLLKEFEKLNILTK